MKTKRKNTFEESTSALIQYEGWTSGLSTVVQSVGGGKKIFVSDSQIGGGIVNKQKQNVPMRYTMLTGGGGISPLCRDLFAAVYGIPSYGAVRFCEPDSPFTDSNIQRFRGFVRDVSCINAPAFPARRIVRMSRTAMLPQRYLSFPRAG